MSDLYWDPLDVTARGVLRHPGPDLRSQPGIGGTVSIDVGVDVHLSGRHPETSLLAHSSGCTSEQVIGATAEYSWSSCRTTVPHGTPVEWLAGKWVSPRKSGVE